MIIIEKTNIKPLESTFSEYVKQRMANEIKTRPRLNVEERRIEIEMSTWDIIWWALKNSPELFKVLYHILKAQASMKTDMKTTLTSILQAVVILIGLFGVKIAPEAQEIIVTAGLAIYALIGVIKGMFTKDKEK